MKKTFARRFAAPGLFVLALFAVTMCRDRPKSETGAFEWSFSGPTMGTAYTVKVVAGELDDSAKLAIHESIRSAVDRVDASMSTYKPGSELSIFNRLEVSTLAVSNGLLDVVSAALEVAALSDGALDITIGPLVDAWGFGPDGPGSVPTDAEIDVLRRVVGWQKLSVDSEAGTLTKASLGLRVDLSAIAKGYAVDQVFEDILQLGYGNVMVEIGGEVRTAGLNGNGSVWRIGVERPDTVERTAGHAIDLSDQALATSGDYRNYYEVEGRRVSHTIDPRSARPVEHDLASVSVVAPTCMSADAWATALNVLGPEKGFEVAEGQGLAALFIVRSGDGFLEIPSSLWATLPGSSDTMPKP